jgi:hypothetical protein
MGSTSNDRELVEVHDASGVLKLLHIVEVAESDPKLHIERGFSSFMREVEQDLGSEQSPLLRWYFYKGSLPVKEIRGWNGTQYV